MNYILIDGSYYCFYRYYALIAWWKNAHPDEELGIPYENELFVEKFKSTFKDKIKEIPKKLKLKPDTCKIIFAKDCSRSDIWRMNNEKTYKANRVYDSTFMGGPFFKLAYEELIPNILPNAMIYCDNLEADDCIAIASKCIFKLKLDATLYIITSDTDYLQLLRPNLFIYTLKYKELKESKHYCGDPEKYLFCKILMGDKSDNIEGIFKKCGQKTADKCWEDDTYFQEKLNKECALEKYEKNKKLISFDEIPKEKIKEFVEKNINKIN